MALYLPDSDSLFVHIPKCGGHFVEEVLKASGIHYAWAQSLPGKSRGHGRRADYRETGKFAFCTMRNLDPWMRSYWRFHMIGGHNRKIWGYDGDEPHRHLGPPLTAWQDWSVSKRDEAAAYLQSMTEGVDRVLDFHNLVDEVCDLLIELGYEIDREKIAALPRANPTILKVELGGGVYPRGETFANIDLHENADFQHDLDSFPYPFPDDSVNEIYSSHCLEHLDNPHGVLCEIARICCLGSVVTIKVPHPHSQMANVATHKHVFSPQQAENMDVHFAENFWKGPKRLKLKGIEYNASAMLEEAKQELPFLSGLSDTAVMRWIPGTCHECVYHYRVEKNQ